MKWNPQRVDIWQSWITIFFLLVTGCKLKIKKIHSSKSDHVTDQLQNMSRKRGWVEINVAHPPQKTKYKKPQ